ncbi:MAG TPA: carboxypeptidase regulatory-like domain-containing protein [Candidatus Aminicenantes bacterium]|nr:carboxypeptidase regulatory-like domain-containing protein [Candidatus Aminicenantes bacterium]HRY65758.1 carboxypeptidase regulatory-like domain-containing protein [Candidatus Aminicenantes bacterium]HRZ72672.1 carboxypeptidase regulatory-like domain-containing protein [Candidatus Aminicenantes bacterium]
MKKSRLVLVLSCLFLGLALAFAAAEFRKSVQPVASGGTIKGLPDIAYDAQADKYLVVWQDRAGRNAEDWDVRSRILDGDGNPVGRVMHIASSGEDERHPRVAASGAGSWLVVWSTGKSIESCTVDAEGRIDGFGSLTPGAARPVDRPDIGFSSLDGRFFVIWEELDESGLEVIKGRSIGGPGEEARQAIVLGRSAYDSLQNPSINQAGGNFFVAWEKQAAGGRVDIEGREVPAGAASADELGNVLVLAGDGARNTAPSVTGAAGTAGYIVVWQARRGPRRSDIAFAGTDGQAILQSGDLTATESELESRPTAFATGLAGRVLVTYQTASLESPGVRDIAARTLGWGDTAASAGVVLDEERLGGGNPAIVRAAGANGRGIIVWDVKEGSGTELYSRGWQEASLADAPVAVDEPVVALADVTISGQVTFGGLGQADVLLGGFPTAVRTDALGFYAAAVPSGWTGTVTPAQPGFTFTPASLAYTNLTADATDQNYAAAFAGGVDDAYEDNDTFETAPSLPLGTTHDLVLNDEDWFKFYVPAEDAGKDLKVRVWGTGFPDATTRRDLDFGVLDASGNLLSYSVSWAPDETAFVCAVAEGWYYVVQYHIGAGGTVYSLSVEVSDAFGLAYISGQVLDDEEETPVAGATVELYAMPFDENVTRPMVFTDANGYYRLGWLPGDYTLRFNMRDFGDDGVAWTPDANYLGDVYEYEHVLTLTGGASLENVNMYLVPGGTITGQITDGTGAPRANARAYVWLGNGTSVASAFADIGGYRIDRLRAANYAVRARTWSGPLINEWFDDKALFASADPVGAAAAGTTAGIDVSLDEKTWGTITGRVLDADMNPVGNLQVGIMDPMGLMLWIIRTDGDGYYTHSRVPAGDWKVYFNAASVGASLVSQYYPGTRFLSEAETVHVVAGAVTESIDAVLPAAGSISGRILNNNGTVDVVAFDTASNYQRSISLLASLAGEPTYTLNNLPPGTYRIMASPSQQGDRIPHWYPDATSYAAAGTVTVAAGATTENIDVTLSGGGGMIIGRVVNSYGYPVPRVNVVAQDASKQAFYAGTISDGDGYFTIRQVPPGSVKVYFNADANWLPYVSEYYNDKTSHDAADAVTVNEGETTALSDAALANQPELAITTASLAGGEIGVVYSQQLGAAGGRPLYRWSLYSGDLPGGLTMTSGGLISGVPNVTGTFSFMVTLTDSSLGQVSITQGLSITIGEYTGEGFTVSGTVTSGGTPLAGVTLEGFEPPAVTDSAGRYAAVVVRSFWGTVTPILAGYAFDPPLREYIVVNSDLTGQDYAASAGHVLSGQVTLNGAGHGGVLMAGLPAALRTDDNGGYSMMLPDGWSGTVTPTLPGFTFSPAHLDYAGISADTTAQNYVAEYPGGADDAYEDNDTFETAAAVTLGTNIPNLVLNDQDWFKVLVPAEDAGKVLAVRIRAISFPNGTAHADPTKSMDLDFGVMDAAGTLLTYNMSGDIDEVSFIPDIQPGWYYIAHTYLGSPGAVYELYAGTSDNFPVATISGRVSDEADQGIDGVTVALYGVPFDWNVCRQMAITDADGNYKIAAFPGNYQVKANLEDFNVSPIDALPDGWLPVRNFLGNSYDYDRTVTLDTAAPITGADVVLPSAGAVSGRVTDGEGNPLVQARVIAYLAGASQASQAFTDADGNYSIRRLRSANYAIFFRPPAGSTLTREWYDDQGAFGASLPVAVTAGATTTGINAVLEAGGRISGLVTNESGDPLPGVGVVAYEASSVAMQSATTQADGSYLLDSLRAGTYSLIFNPASSSAGNYMMRTHGAGGPIAVAEGYTTAGIDVVLQPAGSISGRLTDGDNRGLMSGRVAAVNAATGDGWTAAPDFEGNYLIRNIPPGSYRVRFANSSYPPEWYPEAASGADASLIPVIAGETVSGIDGVLEADGSGFSGRVTDSSGTGIPGLAVVAIDGFLDGFNTSSAVTNADGDYTVLNVPLGTARVLFQPNALPYAAEFYNDKPSSETADAIPIVSGSILPGIDAGLADAPALAVTTSSLPDGEAAVAYSQQLGAEGGRPFYHWTLDSGALPIGLTMTARGEISGMPTTAGTFAFTARVTDSTVPQQIVTRELSITIGEYTGTGYKISGTVLSGEAPLAGVTMSGLPGNPATNAAGGYIAVVPSGWSGTVTPVLSGYAFSPATRAYENVAADAAAQDYAAEAGYRIAGIVTRDGVGLAGVTMAGLPGAPATDAAGAYAAAVPAGWSGTATPTLPGFTFSPADRTYDAIAADATAQDYTAAFAGGVDDAFEDNDSFETAAVLPMGKTSGLIIRDEDWFKFYVPAADAGKDIRVVMNGTAYPDPAIRQDMDFAILDADKRLLSYNTSGCDDETAYIYGAAEGWYYISNVYYEVPGVVYALTIDANADFGLAYVTGTLTDDEGDPIAGAYVELYGSPFDWNVSRPLAMTGEDGAYRIGYTPGLYTVQFNVTDFNDEFDWTPDLNYLSEAYHGGEVLTLVVGETLADIDGQLTPGGVISGRIMDASGNPLGNSVAYAYAGDTVQTAADVSDADGRFEIDRLRAGNYAVRFRAPVGYALATEWHSEATSFASALPVAVAAGATTGGIDAVLGTAGVIAGRITDGEGNPIENVQVTAYDPAGMALQSASTDADGNYSVGRLPTGTFKILFNANTVETGSYLAEYYSDVYDLPSAAGISVTAGQTTGGINAVLGVAGVISGTVTVTDGRPLSGANVYGFPPDNSYSVMATTDITGAYTIRGVPPTDYRVRFRPASEDLTVEWYNDRAGFAAADVVTVALGANVTGIDGVLSNETGLITGRVTNGLGLPIEGVMVAAQDASLAVTSYSTPTDADGRYTLRRLPTGSFKVLFNADVAYLNYVSEYYDDKGGHGSADAVEVTVGSTTSGIDAVLAERPALAVMTESLAAGQLAVVYSGALAGSGGRPFYYWSLDSGTLPDGLAMNSRGEISGVPTMTGAFAFVVRLTDSTSPQQAVTKELSITIGEYTGIGHTISGQVALAGLPLAGVTMSGLPGTPATNGSGGYAAVVADGWSGTVTPVLAGHVFAPATRTYSPVTASVADQDYAAFVGRAISGTVTLDSAGLAGVLMSGLPGDPVSGADGAYSAMVQDGWSGTVTPTLAGYTFAPANRTYEAVAADMTAQDYAASASSRARVDFNKDGQEDLLWRYYGTGGRNRAWFLSHTGVTATLAALDEPAGSLFSDPASSDRGMAPGQAVRFRSKAEREIMQARNWSAKGRFRAEWGRSRLSRVEMSPRPLGPVAAEPGQAGEVLSKTAAAPGDGKVSVETAILGGADIQAVSELNWKIMGTGDFNNDGYTDVLWRFNGTGGRVRVWYMNGTGLISGADIASVPDLSWQIVGTGDFNKDGNVDILWRYNGAGGRVRVWYMNNIAIVAGADLNAVPDLSWQIVGTGDFDKDGNVDILWRYNGTGGRDRVWYMNGIAIRSGADLIAVSDLNWQIAGVADYSGDGNVDVIWRYAGTGGYVYLWDLNGVTWTQTEKLWPVTDQNWKIVSR